MNVKNLHKSSLTSRPVARSRSQTVLAQADFIGSQANQAIVVSTTILLSAGRFGLAPSANKTVTAGLKIKTRDSGMKSMDPAGFTIADTLAFGARSYHRRG